MYTYELNDLIFFIKSLKVPMDHFNIRNYIQFAGNPTRSGTSSKLVHAKALQSSHHHFYFNRFVRLWNHLPDIDTSFLSTQSKTNYHIAGNFDGGKFWRIWRLASDPSKFSPSIFSIQFNCMANTGCLRDYPSIFPPSTSEWSQSVNISPRQNFPLYGNCISTESFYTQL